MNVGSTAAAVLPETLCSFDHAASKSRNPVLGSSIEILSPHSDGTPMTLLTTSNNIGGFQCEEYLGELAELIASRQEGLEGVNPATLQEIIAQLKCKKEEASAVQEEDVSSSQPTLLASHIGPMLLEVLDGFFLVVNAEGYVEFVSPNVVKYLRFSQNDLLNQSIYNFIAQSDHELFSRLLPDSMGWNFSLNLNTSSQSSHRERRNHTFMCRFLVRPQSAGISASLSAVAQLAALAAADQSPSHALHRQDLNGGATGGANNPVYTNLQVSCISLPFPSESGPCEDDFLSFSTFSSTQICLVCVVRRLHDKHSSPRMPQVLGTSVGLVQQHQQATGGNGVAGIPAMQFMNGGGMRPQLTLVCNTMLEILAAECQDSALQNACRMNNWQQGTPIQSLFYPSDRSIVENFIRKVFEHGVETCSSEVRLFTPKGDACWTLTLRGQRSKLPQSGEHPVVHLECFVTNYTLAGGATTVKFEQATTLPNNQSPLNFNSVTGIGVGQFCTSLSSAVSSMDTHFPGADDPACSGLDYPVTVTVNSPAAGSSMYSSISPASGSGSTGISVTTFSPPGDGVHSSTMIGGGCGAGSVGDQLHEICTGVFGMCPSSQPYFDDMCGGVVDSTSSGCHQAGLVGSQQQPGKENVLLTKLLTQDDSGLGMEPVTSAVQDLTPSGRPKMKRGPRKPKKNGDKMLKQLLSDESQGKFTVEADTTASSVQSVGTPQHKRKASCFSDAGSCASDGSDVSPKVSAPSSSASPTSSTSPHRRTPSTGGGQSIRAESCTMLKKLLSQAPPSQPTLPTSIATSPFDKMVKDNRDPANQPRVATNLVENLLSHRRPSMTHNTFGAPVDTLPPPHYAQYAGDPMSGMPPHARLYDPQQQQQQQQQHGPPYGGVYQHSTVGQYDPGQQAYQPDSTVQISPAPYPAAQHFDLYAAQEPYGLPYQAASNVVAPPVNAPLPKGRSRQVANHQVQTMRLPPQRGDSYPGAMVGAYAAHMKQQQGPSAAAMYGAENSSVQKPSFSVGPPTPHHMGQPPHTPTSVSTFELPSQGGAPPAGCQPPYPSTSIQQAAFSASAGADLGGWSGVVNQPRPQATVRQKLNASVNYRQQRAQDASGGGGIPYANGSRGSMDGSEYLMYAGTAPNPNASPYYSQQPPANNSANMSLNIAYGMHQQPQHQAYMAAGLPGANGGGWDPTMDLGAFDERIFPE